MENIKLEVTIDETNTILTALGQQPYIKVADLIQKIQRQGATQLNGSETKALAQEAKNSIPAKNGK